jgi:KAP-like P-loop domain-containing protein
VTVPGDNPIVRATDDALGRAPAAASFARQVLSLDASSGVVVGVLGPWGSGKTSFVNLARADFGSAGAAVLDFNPWMFSGAEQLVESFFVELSSQLRLRPGLQEIGNDLADYGEAFAGLGWLPMVGPWIERGRGAAKVLGKYLSRRREGTQGRREKLSLALRGLEHPIVVVLDDIDRLSTAEIRDVFKLVRLTASFPNIVYVLAFDRGRVEQALGDDGVPGRDYLEKILQVAVDLPGIPDEVLNRQVFTALDQALGDSAEVDEEVWPDVFMEVIKPLIRNMRDVRRYAAAVSGTVDALRGQVALADLLALEAVRVFLPDVFARLRLSIDGLCTPSRALGLGGGGDEAPLKQQIEALIESGSGRGDVVRALIERLFPFGERHIGRTHYGADWAKTYLRDRRIAHEAILRLYLERVAGEQLTNFYDAERAWKVMDDRVALEAFFESLEPERREDVVSTLETYENAYRPEQVVPTAIALWNMAPELPEKPCGMFSFDARLTVGRVTLRLFRSLPDPDATERAAREILPKIETLSAKWEVVTDLGYREGAGHKLVSEASAKALEAEWRAEVRAASSEALVKEDNLTRILIWARRDATAEEPELEVPDDPAVTLAVLRSARSETKSQTTGTRAVRRSPRLAWEPLAELFGEEAILLTRIEALKRSEIELDRDLVGLIDKYVGGWRPNDLHGDDGDET